MVHSIRRAITRLRATPAVRYPLMAVALAAWILCYSLVDGTWRDVLGWGVFLIVVVTAPLAPIFWAIRRSTPLRWVAFVAGVAGLVVAVFVLDESAINPVIGWTGAFLLISTLPDENLGIKREDDEDGT